MKLMGFTWNVGVVELLALDGTFRWENYLGTEKLHNISLDSYQCARILKRDYEN